MTQKRSNRASMTGCPLEPPSEWLSQARDMKSIRKLQWIGCSVAGKLVVAQTSALNTDTKLSHFHELAEKLQTSGAYLFVARCMSGPSLPDCTTRDALIEGGDRVDPSPGRLSRPARSFIPA
jgi:hypothetical protein